MTYIAAFDIGTTNVKGVLVDKHASITAERNIPLEVDHTGGYIEQHPESWYEAIAEIARSWFSSGIAESDIALITFSGQMQDCIAVKRDAAAVRPAILYSDGRAGEQSDHILAELGEAAITEATQNVMNGTLTLPKVLWLKEHERENYEAADYFLISAKDYVIGKLTGSFVTDPTSAATSGSMDIRTREWKSDWLARLGLDASKLPAIMASDEEAGVVHAQAAASTGFLEGTPVMCGIGDAGAATLGAGVYREGEVYAYIGTSGWVAAASSGFMDVSSGAFNLAYVESGKQITIAPMMNAGNAHKWALDVFGEGGFGSKDDAYAAFEVAIGAASRQSGVLFLPYLNGERCPVQDNRASGSFIGLRTTTTKAQMAAAVLEGVAMAMRQLMELIVTTDGEKQVTLIGGGAKSKEWCRIMANVWDCTLVVPEDSQFLPSIGAALLGFRRLEWGNDIGELCNRVKEKWQVEQYVPDPQQAGFYHDQFRKYKRLYPQLADLFAM
ncbi:FGGY family carbohydrate kinase [Paenibacillus sp. J5C_2022]|uniref:xylulokinase n=1 Tax=Paenibacillus sp. J5C2022 TaxID=2977129 RepID=UPI0021CE2047|nr:FGGY family carbohydrate kinase [Paenibacillus sp. J5C2022]MCU6709572.1 FGGY family carbohydrate kinase [Paenibacillus sp. J5C2022]